MKLILHLLVFISFSFTFPAQKLKLVWKSKVTNQIEYPPTMEGNRLYMLSERGEVIAMNKKNGRVLWKSPRQGETLKNMAVYDKEIIFCTRRKVVSVNKRNGKINWTFDNPYVMSLGSEPIKVGDYVICNTQAKSVFAYAISKKKLAWKKELKHSATTSDYIQLGQDVVFSDFKHNIYRMRAKDGKFVWQYKINPSSLKPLVDKNNLICPTGERALICLNSKTGKLVWRTGLNDGLQGCPAGFSETPVKINKLAYGVDFLGNMLAVNSATGKIQWTEELPEDNYTGFIIYKSKLLICSKKHIFLLNPANGQVIKQYDLPRGVFADDTINNPLIEGNYLYFTNWNGVVWKFLMVD